MPFSFRVHRWFPQLLRVGFVALAASTIGCEAAIFAPDLGDDEWRLISLVATDTMADVSGNPDAPTVRFGTETRNPRQAGFAGTLACNRFAGRIEMKPGGFMRAMAAEQTIALCIGPDIRIQARFVDALATAVRFDRRGGALYLTSRDGTRMEFRAR